MTAAPVSHWFARLDPAGMPAPRPRLDGDARVDVCIVGGGYTGLWTALELRRSHPDLDVLVVEREVCGFGASGRNGGWVQGELAGSTESWERRGGPGAAVRMHHAIRDTLGEIEDAVQREGIACDWHRGGTLTVAQTPLELGRLRAAADAARAAGTWADGEDAFLGAEELRERVAIRGGQGAWANPHCARVQPAALARGLADAVARAGARIVEDTPVTAIEPARGTVPAKAHTPHGTVTARWVVRATEGYTAGLPGERRTIAPITSSMIVTEPLSADLWGAIGWDGAETILDGGHQYHYLQRTADGRIAIGGRGVPYGYGSDTRREGPLPASTQRTLRGSLVRLFGDDMQDVRIDGAWHGVLGVPRDWTPFVGADEETGLAFAGGYVGEGVAAANLAGRTLRDLLVGRRRSELATLPWVLPAGTTPPRWEPEPLRWTGIRSVYALLGLADEIEHRTGKPSRVAAVANRIAGR